MNAFAFAASLVLFVGGLLIMGFAFYVEGFQAIAFLAGILCTCAGIALPIHVLKRIDP
jgi:hypothetical protein